MLRTGDRVYCQCWSENPPRPLKGDRQDTGTVIAVDVKRERAEVKWDLREGDFPPAVDIVDARTGMCREYPFQARKIPA